MSFCEVCFQRDMMAVSGIHAPLTSILSALFGQELLNLIPLFCGI